MRHAQSYQYMRLCWSPKPGDRVFLSGQKFRIDKVHKSRGVKLVGQEKYHYPGELVWRPTPKDFDSMIEKMKNLWVYEELIGNRLTVGVTVNGRTRPLQGRSRQILTQVLELRAIDSALSVTINRIFERAYSTHNRAQRRKANNVRLHSISTKGSDTP